MMKREWLIATVQMLFTLTVALPLWTALGLALIAPSVLLKRYSTCFPEAFQKRIDHLYAFTTEIFYILTSSARYAMSQFNELELQGTGKPILLVHGYLHNASAWSTYLTYFKKENLGPVYTIDLGEPFLSLEAYAKKVEQKALEIQKQTRRKDLALVGHSMGGIVSSLYATKIAAEGTVTDLFTIGAPLKGAPLANWLGVGPAIRAMRPNSPLLQSIRERIEQIRDHTRFYHIGSDSDQIVPAQYAILEGGNELRVNHVGHANLLTSKKIADWICSKIKSHQPNCCPA